MVSDKDIDNKLLGYEVIKDLFKNYGGDNYLANFIIDY
jgi:hypothetical protein